MYDLTIYTTWCTCCDTDHTQKDRGLHNHSICLVFWFGKGCVTFPHVHISWLDEHEMKVWCLFILQCVHGAKDIGNGEELIYDIPSCAWDDGAWEVWRSGGVFCFLLVSFIMNQLVSMLTCIMKMSSNDYAQCSWSRVEEDVKFVPTKGTLVKFLVMRDIKNDKEFILWLGDADLQIGKVKSCFGNEVVDTSHIFRNLIFSNLVQHLVLSELDKFQQNFNLWQNSCWLLQYFLWTTFYLNSTIRSKSNQCLHFIMVMAISMTPCSCNQIVS